MPESHLTLDWSAYAEEIGLRVAAVRRLRRVSQTELAGVTGISRSQIQNIEQNKTYGKGEPGNTSLKFLFTIAQALGVSPGIFIPDGVPLADYRSAAAREWPLLEEALADRVAATPLPATTRPSARLG